MKNFRKNIAPIRTKKGGYMLLLSMLISSILLAIALGIYSLGLKELILASFAKNSEIAIAAADRGLECALYWDAGYPQNGRKYTAFGTSTGGSHGTYLGANVGSEPGGVLCQTGSATIDISTTWSGGGGHDNYTTDFGYDLANNSCTMVTVVKDWNGGVEKSTITARGYNMKCAEITNTSNLSSRLVQRVLQVKLLF